MSLILSKICVFSLWRRHERDCSTYKQAVHGRLVGLCVPLHTFYWLSLGTGGGCCGWQEHQYLHQLEKWFQEMGGLILAQFSTGVNTLTGWFVILKLTYQHKMSNSWNNYFSVDQLRGDMYYISSNWKKTNIIVTLSNKNILFKWLLCAKFSSKHSPAKLS